MNDVISVESRGPMLDETKLSRSLSPDDLSAIVEKCASAEKPDLVTRRDTYFPY